MKKEAAPRRIGCQLQWLATNMEGAMIEQKVADSYLDDARGLLGDLRQCHNALRHCWVEGEGDEVRSLWCEIHDLIWQFCQVVQSLHMSLGGIDPKPFEEAVRVLDQLVDFGDELLKGADGAGHEVPSVTRERVEAVVHRCERRIRELHTKCEQIGPFQLATNILLDPP